MEFSEVVRSRRMIRDFMPDELAPGQLDELLDLARRVPSAGFSQGIDFVVFEGPEQTTRFWDHTLPAAKRPTFPWPGLLRAPAIVLPMSDPQAYLERYSEQDKAHAGLGTDEAAWPVPYWHIDTGMAAMVLLQAAVDAGLGALFFGIFANEEALLCDLGVPPGVRPIGAIAIGHPTADARKRRREASAAKRPRRPLAEIVHRNGW